MEKLTFALYQYCLLALFAVACYGLGRPVTGWFERASTLSRFLRVPLRVASGMGVLVIALFLLGLIGYLNAPVLLLLLLLGLGLALLPGSGQPARTREGLVGGFRGAGVEGLLWGAIAASAGLYLLLKPLQPPLDWDELMYHLPYARLWAEQGALTINEWLRYPLCAYNLNLLYAASMVLGNDVLPHLLHAFCGALTAVLVFGFAQRYLDRQVGVAAVVVLLVTTRWFWGNAYVDLGVMLFWACAFAALALRYEQGDSRYSYLGAFLAGIAVGIKYQALFFLPVFALVGLLVERRSAAVIRSALILVAVGGYWYLRNFSISGDPLHPIGARLFGYWLWSPVDLVGQHANLDNVRAWPSWLLFPAIGAAVFWRDATSVERGLLLTTAAAAIIWYAVSGYPRYLLAFYPMLALLSASFLLAALRRWGAAERFSTLWRALDFRLRLGLLSLLLLAVGMNAQGSLIKYWNRVLPDGEERVAYLGATFPGYALLLSVGEEAFTTLYQLGFEEELYYLGPRVRGDWFGPGRYREVLSLSADAPALAHHLDGLGADGLLLNLGKGYVSGRRWDPAILEYFELVARSDKAVLYRRRPHGQVAAAGAPAARLARVPASGPDAGAVEKARKNP